jgi:2-polyprenyl-6-methoxyphenol hydroxylase-like FAD-dependent oxidoreductase
MRGFYRPANGPGWTLIGDAGHFKHPATAQGISDAVEQAVHLADSLDQQDPDLEHFHDWRRERSIEHYEWSYDYARWPRPDVAGPYMRGLSSDPEATQQWLDVFTRRHRPSVINTPERLSKWFAGPVE